MTQTTHTQWRAKIKLTAIMVAAATSAEAGRPLTIDDAEPVPHRHFELEAGAWYACGSGLRHFHLPFVLAYGLLPRAEFGVGFGGQVQERTEELGEKKTVTDLGDLVLSTKAKVLTADRFRADHTLTLAVKLPTASYDKGMGSGRVDVDLTWIASKRFTEKFALHLNVGHTWTGDRTDEPFDEILHYGIALEYQIAPKWQAVAEIFADTPITAERDTAVQLRCGARWQVIDGLALDAAVGAGLREPAPDVTATIGLTWTFGAQK